MNPLFITPLADVSGVIQGVVMTLFVLSGILLIFVVLIQEGKGGGIAGAFGGAAGEAFGVKAGSVNRFTAYVGTAFIVLALIHAGISSRRDMGTTATTQRRSTVDEPSITTVPPKDESERPPTPPSPAPTPAPGGGAPPPTPAPAQPPAPAPAPVDPGAPPAMER